MKPTKGLNREYLLRSQATCDKKNRSRPSSACSSSGRLSTRVLATGHHFKPREGSSVLHSEKPRKKISKPAWEDDW